MWKFIFGILFSFVNFFSHLSHCSILTFNEKQFILDSHNWIRAYVAKGVHGLPPTSNMRVMDWNEELEQKSKTYNKCRGSLFNSYEIKFRANTPYLTIKYKSKEFTNRIIITNLIESIVHQLNSSFYIECMGNILCLVRNQILEPQLSAIGCSVTECEPFTNILTCTYNSKAILNSFLESTNIGFPCSNCSSRNMNCLNDVLCAKESHCYKTATKQCSCMITKESCLSHGIFLADKCTCICKPGYKGSDCQDIVFKAEVDRTRFLINTENKPNPNIETKIRCYDQLWECPNWAAMGLCFLKTVRSSCSESCEKCESDEQLISHFKSILMLKDAGSECVDKRSECQMWADKNYCYIKAVQITCPRVCALCPDPPEPEKFVCKEDPPRAATCKQVIGNYLCYSPDMKEVCPVTCGNTKCGTPLPTTTLKDPCTEPESHLKPCSDFKKVGYCSIKEVMEYCPVTCEMDKCRTDPELCKDLKEFCSTEKIKKKCKQTCGTSVVPTSALKSTFLPTTEQTAEPSVCPNMKDLCTTPGVKALCKKTCASSTTPLSTTSGSSISSTSGTSGSTTPLSTEPSVCPDMKDLCTTPGVKALCKKTCASSTTPLSTTSGSSISSTSGTSGSTTPLSTEPSVCPDMKSLCASPGVKTLCKKTCATTSTPISSTSGSSKSSTSGTSGSTTPLSTEPSVCPDMKSLCASPGVKTLCKKTCATTSTPISSTSGSSKSSTSGTSGSITSLTMEPSVCPSMKDLCFSPGVKALCKISCATSILPISSTPGLSKFASVSRNLFSTESNLCGKLKHLCGNPDVAKSCKQTCATSSTKISSTSSQLSTNVLSTESSMCTNLKNLCDDLNVKEMCKTTCAASTVPLFSSLASSKSTPTTSVTCSPATRLTENPECSKMAMHCNNVGVKDLCPITCGECTSTVSQHTEASTQPGLSTEFSGCTKLKDQCKNPGVAMLCPKICSG